MLGASDIAELRGTTFGFMVRASEPILAERSVFFNRDGVVFAGGASSEGVTAPATHWSFTDGSTGFFQTTVLVANPGERDARVVFNYLLDTGERVSIVKTVPAKRA